MSLYRKVGLFFYNLFYNLFEFLFFFTDYWWWKFVLCRAWFYMRETSMGIFKREYPSVEGMSEENFIYGETGVLTAKLLLQEVEIRKYSLIYDLGCGRGTFLFAANFLFSLRGVGVELFTPYITHGLKLKKALKVGGIHFVNDNILNVDLSPADIIFFAGTTFERKVLEEVWKNMKEIKPGAVVISVHHKMPEDDFVMFYEGKFPFSWGTDQVYYYKKK